MLVTGLGVLLLVLAFQATGDRMPTVRTALETMMTMSGFAAGWLLLRHFEHSRRLADLMLFATALMIGLTELWVGVLPVALNLGPERTFNAAALLADLFVAVAFIAAAYAKRDRVILTTRQPLMMTVLLSVAAVVAAQLGGTLLHAHLLSSSPLTTASEVASDHPLGLMIVVATALLLALAATRLMRRDRDVDELLAVAAILFAASSVYHFAPGSLTPFQVDPGEALEAVAFVLIFAAAVRNDKKHQAEIAKEAALAERVRVARDLHDGIAQDLAFIAAHGARVAADNGSDDPLVVAAKHALDVSRSTISDLSDSQGTTAYEALTSVALELRNRFDIAIGVETDVDVEPTPSTRTHLARIAREAIVNAARHGHAKHVVVSLRDADHGVVLRIVDDGCGIGGSRPDGDGGGFGLRSIRERAAELGGDLVVRQLESRGTELEVLFPWIAASGY